MVYAYQNGNITEHKIRKPFPDYITAKYDAANNNALRYRYKYDEANQLVRVDDNVRGITTIYQYNKGGNRVSEKFYNYTLSDSLGTPIKEVKSAYNYLTWKDRLSSYDGKTITYDTAGNPTQYGNKSYTWEGKFLTEVADTDGSKTQFEYDANGFRTQKRQYGTDGRLEYYVDYIWLDGKLTQQSLTLMAYRSDGTSYGIGPISAKFVYEDNSQQPQSCLLGGVALLFVRNLQGDVVAVVNGDGSIWAEFTYDAWGNVEVTSPLEDESIREAALQMLPLLCPLTYRGYNYDFTTGLYYLQSRYYNPEWGRFLNCDDTSILLATQGETHGANLFAYCNNNPVNRVDYTGQSSTSLTATTAFAYGLCIFAALEYELALRGLSYVLNYDMTNDCDVDFTHNIITVHFKFYVANKVFYKEYYMLSISVGLVQDWFSYRDAVYDEANSDKISGLNIILTAVGFFGTIPGIITTFASYGISSVVAEANKMCEELGRAMRYENCSSLMAYISEVCYTLTQYPFLGQKGETIRSYPCKYRTYLFLSDSPNRKTSTEIWDG